MLYGVAREGEGTAWLILTCIDTDALGSPGTGLFDPVGKVRPRWTYLARFRIRADFR